MSTRQSPTLRSEAKSEMKLPARKLWRESGDHRGQVITCLQGVVWLTHESIPGDYVLRPGQKFVVARRGLLLAQGLRDAVLQIADPAFSNSASAKAPLN